MNELCGRIRAAMDSMSVADVHTHLGTSGLRQARNLADIVSYHWLSVELSRAAGRKFQADPSADPIGYLREVLPYFPDIRNTVNHYAFMGMLRDLYGITDRTLTDENWQRADDMVRSRATDAGWLKAVLDRARIGRVLVSLREGMPDATPRYVPYEYGEYLFALRGPEQLRALAGKGNPPPATPDALAAAIAARVDRLAEQRARALHVWAPGTWNYAPADPARVAGPIQRLAAGEKLDPVDADLVASFAADATASAAGRHRMVLQLFHGSIAYTQAGQSSYWNPEFLRSLARHFVAHPDTRYDLFLASRIPSHEAAILARIHPNLAVSGAWWHGFTPTTMLTFFRDRLEMLPNTAWNAFYSDGYIVEWIYAKLLVTKNRLAHALAGLADEDFLTEDDALDIARRVLDGNAAAFYGI